MLGVRGQDELTEDDTKGKKHSSIHCFKPRSAEYTMSPTWYLQGTDIEAARKCALHRHATRNRQWAFFGGLTSPSHSLSEKSNPANRTEIFLVYSNIRSVADEATLAWFWLTLAGVKVVGTCAKLPGGSLLCFLLLFFFFPKSPSTVKMCDKVPV